VSSLRPVSGTTAEVRELLEEWEAESDPAPLVVETSGSTGRPKRVVLSRGALRASADATHRRLGGPGQWLLNLPPVYVAGLQVVFRSLRAGVPPAEQHGSVADAVEAMGGPRRYVSLVPTQLVRLLRDPAETRALTRFDAVLVGGGPLRPEVRREATVAGVRVVSTYGMSETCGGCVYDGLPLDGVAVRIDAAGEVLLAGPVLFEGYEGEPDRTRAVLDDGWLRTADVGRLDEDGRLQVLGRTDDVVISGGVKVPAVAVQQMLECHPAVDEAAVIGVPDPEWGERVVAVIAGVGLPALAELRDLVTPRPWAPREVVAVQALPRLANGKLDRVAVREIALGETATGGPVAGA
jgi:O-succinylbenzoic acid--CoA ligase